MVELPCPFAGRNPATSRQKGTRHGWIVQVATKSL